jgi:hypothetical protein
MRTHGYGLKRLCRREIMPDLKLTQHDIHRMFGTIDDHRVLEIIALGPSAADLEVALAYLSDMSDVMGEERQPLAGTAAGVYEIIIRDEALEEETTLHRV